MLKWAHKKHEVFTSVPGFYLFIEQTHIINCRHVDSDVIEKGLWLLTKTKAEIGHYLVASLLVGWHAHDGIILEVDVFLLGAEELWEVPMPIYLRLCCI